MTPNRTCLVMATALLGAAACGVVQLKDPAGTQNAQGASVVATRGGGHPCDRGRDLSADEARPWQEKWSKIEAARASGDVGQGTEACGLAKQFAATCPRWDDRMSEVYGVACAVKQRAPVVAKEEPPKPGCPARWIATKEAGAMVRNGMTAKMRMDLSLAGLKDPNDARRVIGDVKADQHLLECDDEDAAREMAPIVEKWAQDTEAAIDEEIRCRASDECRARRIANGICATMQDKREAQQQIATEKANPSGVVSLSTLHTLGERIQVDDATIANSKRDYASLAKKPFTAAACSP